MMKAWNNIRRLILNCSLLLVRKCKKPINLYLTRVIANFRITWWLWRNGYRHFRWIIWKYVWINPETKKIRVSRLEKCITFRYIKDRSRATLPHRKCGSGSDEGWSVTIILKSTSLWSLKIKSYFNSAFLISFLATTVGS